MGQRAIALQTELKYGLQQIRSELNGIRQFLAARRRERERLDLKYHLAAVRFETALLRYASACQKGGFNANQPRVPVGSSEGGQWTSDTGGTARVDDQKPSRVRLADAENNLGSPVISDAFPDPINTGAQYAQTKIEIDTSAMTGVSTIDDTTKRLARTLATVVDSLPKGSGRLYGTLVHIAFANAVRAQQIPGIGFFDVETTFSLAENFRYGSKNSIRTDVILRNGVGDIIAL